MPSEGSNRPPRSPVSLNTILAVAGVAVPIFLGVWWFATWLASVSQLTAQVSDLQKIVQAEQNTLTTISTTQAALIQELADDQAEFHNARNP